MVCYMNNIIYIYRRKPPLDYSKRRFRYFQKTHCHIGAGYPRKINFQDVVYVYHL